jgi:hypothetical protein
VKESLSQMPSIRPKTLSLFVFISLLALLTTACNSMMSSATGQLAKNLAVSIQNHNDPDTVASAIPAYLLMIDSFIQSDPENVQMLQSGAKLYASYASTFVNEPLRAQKLSQRSLDYALQAACLENTATCQAKSLAFDKFQEVIHSLPEETINILFVLGQSWAVWLQANKEDWNAIAELPRVRLIMEKVMLLDETYQQGSAHLYMGILHSLLPATLGGKPDVAKQHFEKAISLSEGKNLMAKVSYAEHHARLVFDQQLHDKLLNEVISSRVEQPGLTLMNTLAQQKAQKLLVSGKEYF